MHLKVCSPSCDPARRLCFPDRLRLRRNPALRLRSQHRRRHHLRVLRQRHHRPAPAQRIRDRRRSSALVRAGGQLCVRRQSEFRRHLRLFARQCHGKAPASRDPFLPRSRRALRAHRPPQRTLPLCRRRPRRLRLYLLHSRRRLPRPDRKHHRRQQPPLSRHHRVRRRSSMSRICSPTTSPPSRSTPTHRAPRQDRRLLRPADPSLPTS